MNREIGFETRVADWLVESAGTGRSDYLSETLERTTARRQRPAWTFPGRWLPMEVSMTRTVAPAPRTAWALLVLALIVALAVATLAIVGGRHVPPPFGPARTGLLAFDSNGDIVVAAADGTGRRVLRSGKAGNNFSPTWSRDGLRLVFASQEGPQQESPTDLVVMDADGSNVHVVVKAMAGSVACAGNVDWSGSGLLAYPAAAVGQPRIFVVDPDRGGSKPIGDPSLSADTPTWSPDSTRIAFKGGSTAADLGVYVMGADGSGIKRVTAPEDVVHPCGFENPQWSLDGRRLLYFAGTPGFRQVRIANADGSGDRSISDGSVEQWWPTWAPDDSKIAFDQLNPPGAAFYASLVVANPDGSDPVVPPGGDRCSGEPPIWAPDGKTVYCYDFNPSTQQIENLVALDPHGGRAAVLIPVPGWGGFGSVQRLAP